MRGGQQQAAGDRHRCFPVVRGQRQRAGQQQAEPGAGGGPGQHRQRVTAFGAPQRVAGQRQGDGHEQQVDPFRFGPGAEQGQRGGKQGQRQAVQQAQAGQGDRASIKQGG
jgi:hypothetical protein